MGEPVVIYVVWSMYRIKLLINYNWSARVYMRVAIIDEVPRFMGVLI
jgi:uncharacterized membrane protein YesL